MAPEPKDVEFESFLDPCFFRADSFQIALATCNFFIGMITCFQIKHCYMKQIVIDTFDQQ